jgi:hypothetical protein
MLRLIADMFKQRRELIPVCPHEAKMAVFSNMVERHVGNRKSIPDYMAPDPTYQVPKYVVLMCEDLVELIDRPNVKLIDVLRIEKTAVGHSDYLHKLALRCYHCTIENETTY